MVKRIVLCLLLACFSGNAYPQSVDAGDILFPLILGTVVKAADSYAQYSRITKEINNFWENEIAEGLGEGRYVNSPENSRFNRISAIFNNLL